MGTFCLLFIPVHTIFSKTLLSVPIALLAFFLYFLFHSPWFHAEGRQFQFFKSLELIISLLLKTVLLKVSCPESSFSHQQKTPVRRMY